MMQTSVMPGTIDRLLVTSLVLAGSILTLSIGLIPRSSFSNGIANSILSVMLMAVVANHLVLYHLAKKQTTGLSPSADGTAAYPNCLFSLSNIIFTSLIGFLFLGWMWQPILWGIIVSGPYASSFVYYPVLIPILQGILGYAEGGVLLTLFAFYVRQRKAHQRAARAAALKV